ncbi:Uncharacterised protein [Anaerobiospirillum thomasii]|uniref:DUF6429 family protein n=1 Tax=Anaerobiospirillum thomasii TaxID=179995 RepID=UPI000D8D77A5|nr:DUF6429 family protein [Anaerobiospirillum thomasii]SPT67830.1 Uncharacterised protein [Anaerobiospirillum thomasii]
MDKIKDKDSVQISNAKIDAKDALEELTLMLLYLTRFYFDNYCKKENIFPSWKRYDFDTLNKLDDADFIIQSRRSYKVKSVTLTDSGVEKARELLAKYGIEEKTQS